MTVSTATSFNSYAGNGSTTSFAYAFKIFQDSNLVVTLVNDTTGVETTQTLTTDYTVTGAGSDSGGSVVFVTAPASGNTVVIRRVLPVTQETNYVPNDPFPAEAHEDALDKLTMLVQQEVASSELAVQFPEGDVGSGINNILPSVTGRSEKLLKFGLDGGVEVIAASDLSSAIIGANYAVDTFTGTGSTTVYTLSAAPGSKTNTAIYIDGVYQAKANYSVSGSTLTFTTAPPLNSAIEVVIGDAIPAGAATTASAVSYTQGGTGAVTTNVQAKLRETVSVKDFGAVGDGVTDDNAAFVAAITNNAPIYIPVGTYIVTGLTLIDNTIMFGEGDLSTVKLKNSTDANLLSASTKSNIRLRNFKLDGNWASVPSTETKHTIRFDDVEDVQITGMTITGSSTDGISLKTNGVDNTDNVIISNNRIVNCGRNGIAVLRGSNIKIHSNHFEQCGLVNIDLEPNIHFAADRISIWGNTGETAPYGHVAIQYVNNVQVTNNIYQNSKTKRTGTQTGSASATSGNITLTDSAATFQTWGISVGDMLFRTESSGGCGFKVVSVDSETQLTIRRTYASVQTMGTGDSYTFYGDRIGYWLWNTSYSGIDSNIAIDLKTLGGTLTDPGGHGVRLEGASFCTVNNNQIRNVQDRGIWFGSTSDCVVNGNTVSSNGGYAVYFDATSSLNNVIGYNKLDGNSGTYSGLPVTANVAPTENLGTADIYMSADQDIASGSGYVDIQFDTATRDLNGWFDTSTYRYTPQITGRYQVNLKVTYETVSANKTIVLTIEQNGSQVSYAKFQTDQSGQITGVLPFSIEMNGTTDYLEFKTQHNDTVTARVDGTAVHSRVQIYYIGRT